MTNNFCSISDINLDSLQLAFASANMPQTVCSNVAVISDNLLEEDGEMICLTLTSNDSDVMIGPHSVTCIVIMDTSSKYILMHYSDVLLSMCVYSCNCWIRYDII